MNWIKLEHGMYPPFGKLVLLYQKDGKREMADCGSLQSIDKDGYNWDFGTGMTFEDLFVTTRKMVPKQVFKPTHWCEIIPPNDNTNEQT